MMDLCFRTRKIQCFLAFHTFPKYFSLETDSVQILLIFNLFLVNLGTILGSPARFVDDVGTMHHLLQNYYAFCPTVWTIWAIWGSPGVPKGGPKIVKKAYFLGPWASRGKFASFCGSPGPPDTLFGSIFVVKLQFLHTSRLS